MEWRQWRWRYHVGKRESVLCDHQRDVERGLEGGLVPTGQRSAGASRLEIRHACDPLRAVRARVLRLIEAAQLIVQNTDVLDRQLRMSHLCRVNTVQKTLLLISNPSNTYWVYRLQINEWKSLYNLELNYRLIKRENASAPRVRKGTWRSQFRSPCHKWSRHSLK